MSTRPSLDFKRLNHLDNLLINTIGKPGQLPGVEVLVWRRGDLSYFRWAGLRDIERGLPIEQDTIFRIYSMTKPIVSVALLMLLEEGRFRLDTPLLRNSCQSSLSWRCMQEWTKRLGK